MPKLFFIISCFRFLYFLFKYLAICYTSKTLSVQVCHARISTPSAQLGLPELQLGIIPGMGGILNPQHILHILSQMPQYFSNTTVCGVLALGLNVIMFDPAPISFWQKGSCIHVQISTMNGIWKHSCHKSRIKSSVILKDTLTFSVHTRSITCWS